MQIQDVFIQKKLLYKFDKKIELLFQSIFMLDQTSTDKMVDESQESDKKIKYLTKQAILEEIEQLKFQNFKYRTALISAKKDQTSNQDILKKAEQEIIESRNQVEKQSRELEHSLKCKRNKEEYNHLAESLKNSFEPLSVQNEKLNTITKEIEEMQKKYEKEISQYEKKQKCLRLALSALKCVIDTQEPQQDSVSNGSLYIVQAPANVSDAKISQPMSNSAFFSSNGDANLQGRQEGEQLEGGEIQY